MTTVQLMHNKKTLRFHVTEMKVYKQAKVLHVTRSQNKSYYLLFYKNSFINAKKTTSIRLQSFLKDALQYGEAFTANHPLTKALLNEHTTYRLISNNQMVQKLSKNYNESEMLYVLAMFDNYLDERKIQALCKKTYYSYRRNGKLMNSYRVLINYIQIRPHDTFAQDMLQHVDFQTFKVQYEDIEQLSQKWADPLYLESVFFDQQFPDYVIKPLLNQYQTENRKFDQLYLYYKKSSILQDITPLDQLAQELLSEKNQITLWEYLLPHYPQPHEVIKKLVAMNGFQAILRLHLQEQITIEDQDLFEKTLHAVSAEQLAENYQPLLRSLINQAQLEKTLPIIIKKILPHVSLPDILTMLENVEHPIIQKLRKMKQLTDNPDQQLALGEIYYELEQYDEAIACFEWEMELAPEDAKPVQYLYKSYEAKGDIKQANTYKQLMLNIPS